MLSNQQSPSSPPKITMIALTIISTLLMGALTACTVSFDGLGGDDEPVGITKAEPQQSTAVVAQTERATPLVLNDQATHRNNVEVTLETIEFAETGTWITFAATNPRRIAIRLNGCCRGTYLADDRGNRYLLQGPAGDPTMVIDGGATVRGTLFFEGAVPSSVETIQVVFGDHDNGSATDPEASWPTFFFGPYVIERG